MRQIAAMTGRELTWTQPHAFRMEYELRAADELIATLRFKSSFGSFATAESADGCWTFKRVGFWQTRATVRECGAETDLASFKNNTWSNGGTLELPDGRKFLASTNFWQTKYDFRTEAGEVLFSYTHIGGLFHSSALVEIQPAAANLPELAWMVMLGWYLVIMMQMDSAAASGAVVAGAGAVVAGASAVE